MSTKFSISDDEGVVFKKYIGMYDLWPQGNPERVVRCTISARLLKSGSGSKHSSASSGDPVAIGDVVRFISTGDGTGMITEILPRRNYLARRSAVPMPGAQPFEQVIVANVDQAVPVFAAANPTPRWHLLDRYLVSAESYGLPAIVFINKLDLLMEKSDMEKQIRTAVAEYQKIGYPVYLVSATTGEGVDELREALRGRISVFVGKSGVGKTSLLNALQPGLGLRVSAVNQKTGKGRHTTTWQEMFSLEFGGAILDTPGVQEYGVWDSGEADLAQLFPEMRSWLGRCRFGLSCQHNEEPGCAVRQAVMNGRISPYRYQSYLRLHEEWSSP